ncbi:MAG TPA: tRNA pseudouridine(55) synthase TruB [Microbacteriaceae bacterium]|nr:tRNA pseudouridine(55) synthase TruB [Microbacteriaceae bacterium]
MPAGILLVDKPSGLTSHDVVARVRRLAGTRKVGHAGTLDPMATGLLVLGLESATRLLHYVVGLDKEYVATVWLGRSSTTDDAEGELGDAASPEAIAAVNDERILEAMAALSGDIQQVPSSVSAIKVNGERAYARVRAGEAVELAARPVTVGVFELVGRRSTADRIELDVRVECSSGTYIRALARDLGDALGVGGHLTMLRRTRIGRFDVADAQTLDALLEGEPLAPIGAADAAASALPIVRLTEAQTVDIGHGKRIPAESGPPGELVAGVSPNGRLVAILERRADTWKVATGFPAEETS